jgi:ankyrin repeat protein
VQVHFESLLNDAAKGRTENVRNALAKDPTFASRRGTHNRTLAWVATYHNRPKILELVLNAGGDCNSPACDPMHATKACDIVHLGTGVSVTPLAIAKKWQPALVAPLVEHGAIDDVFTAAWLGDVPALRDHVDCNPDLVNVLDPADDFQEVTPLCHAVCGGSIDAVKLLIERGAEVRQHSGKLLTLAVVMNRVDMVRLLIDHGADVQRVDLLGRLDDAERPVADLLIANGKKVPRWMLPHACRPDVSSNELHRVAVLLDYGASLDDRTRFGLTALHYAVRSGKLPVIELLLKRGAEPNVLDGDGLTPLLHLGKTRSKADPVPVMELLAASGADLDARDEGGSTLLMAFAKQGKVQAVRWLLAHGADGHTRNNRGKTAAEIGRANPEIIRMLTN